MINQMSVADSRMISSLAPNSTGLFLNGVFQYAVSGNSVAIEKAMAGRIIAIASRARLTGRIIGGNGRVAMEYQFPRN